MHARITKLKDKLLITIGPALHYVKIIKGDSFFFFPIKSHFKLAVLLPLYMELGSEHGWEMFESLIFVRSSR